MDEQVVESVKAQVYQKFPEMRGVEPSTEEKAPGPSPAASPRRTMYLFTFRKSMQAEDGTVLTQTVRATVDGEGNVVKVVGSR